MKDRLMTELRRWTIALLVIVGVIAAAGEAPHEGFMIIMIIKSAVAAAFWGLAAILFKRWDKRGLLGEDNL